MTIDPLLLTTTDLAFLQLLGSTKSDITAFVMSLPFVLRPQDLPIQTSGLYFVCAQKEDRILYVGKAVDLRRRWVSHHLKDMIKDTGNFRIYYLAGEASLAGEAFFICVLRPLMNRSVHVSF